MLEHVGLLQCTVPRVTMARISEVRFVLLVYSALGSDTVIQMLHTHYCGLGEM